ncbi:homeodomain-interacting protein kinase 2-like isoform X2 [Xyrichtys novacula]|uniref:Homeodomain-interacting protein kinase 2-like isoform X2 n=1 Tax=Xyrichtys novacula TaxID=13765 RepID=A0AAV1F3E0_XYRNO|nr:homeodomain-interacting protein kinase 2-like isoform X2 [Xyrichtys novacula]
MGSSSSSSLCPTGYNLSRSNYIQLMKIGSGSFGVVLKCIKVDTQEIVAVKIQEANRNFENEYNILKFLMTNNLDKKNIVKFIEMFPLQNNKRALVFEMLDQTLQDHLRMTYRCTSTPPDLASIRSIIHQMAIALDDLKTNKVIHSDIKPDNIMLLHRVEQPVKVKLIDFGLAFPTSLATQGSKVQPTFYRAPEIILGLPFSEAIDMWSLGVVMAYMLTGYLLFQSDLEYIVLQYMVELLGALPGNISGGKFTERYCKKTPSGQWRLKTPEECLLRSAHIETRPYLFRNLDQLETETHLANEDNDEKKACIDLLKAMLQMDPSKRITPSQVLAHLFITRRNFQQSSNPSSSRSGLNKQTPQKPLLIQVKPAPPKRCLKLEEDTEDELVELQMRPRLPPYFSEDSDTEEKTSEDSDTEEETSEDSDTEEETSEETSEDSDTEEETSEDSDTEDETSEDSETEEETSEDRTVSSGDPAPDERTQKEEKKKRKKKGGSCLVRFCRWLLMKLRLCTATVHATD